MCKQRLPFSGESKGMRLRLPNLEAFFSMKGANSIPLFSIRTGIPYSAKFSWVFSSFAQFPNFSTVRKLFQRKFLTCKLQFSHARESMAASWGYAAEYARTLSKEIPLK